MHTNSSRISLTILNDKIIFRLNTNIERKRKIIFVWLLNNRVFYKLVKWQFWMIDITKFNNNNKRKDISVMLSFPTWLTHINQIWLLSIGCSMSLSLSVCFLSIRRINDYVELSYAPISSGAWSTNRLKQVDVC